MEIRKLGTQQQQGNVRMRLKQDRISSLPDEIIHHILSFNDTKYAVQSSLLSSRWKLIWTTLPFLKISTKNFPSLSSFSKFVSRILSYRNNQIELSVVNLYFRGQVNRGFVHKIAKYAASHNVQMLSIIAHRYKSWEDLKFPLCIFRSQSLKHLSLETHPNKDFHIFPLPQSPWDSPALTTIELTNIWLGDEKTRSLDLFSECVNLMNLTLVRCRTIGLKVMKILCPRLVSLTISDCSMSRYKIMTPTLTSFCFDGGYPVRLFTGGLNSLDKVHLDMFISTSTSEFKQREARILMNMLHELRSAKFLTLKKNVIKFLSKALDLLEHQPSPFCNLKCLSIEVFKVRKRPTNQVISYLLNSSPTATVNMELPKVSNPKLPSTFNFQLQNLLEMIRRLKEQNEEL